LSHEGYFGLFLPFSAIYTITRQLIVLTKCRLTTPEKGFDEQFFKASRNWQSCSPLGVLAKIKYIATETGQYQYRKKQD
jgi:hypothetical protein